MANKTIPHANSVRDFIAAVPDPARRADAESLNRRHYPRAIW